MKMLYQKLGAGILLTAVFLVLFIGTLCMGEGLQEGGERILMRREGRHTEQAEQLHALKVLDASDMQGIEALMHQIIDEVFLYGGLDGDMEPFLLSAEKDVLKVQYQVNINRPDSFLKLTGDYSAIILALVPDIRQVEWTYPEIQAGGRFETKTLKYNWKMMQKDDFIDGDICKITKRAAAENFGASAADLQFLLEHFAYYEKGKLSSERETAPDIDRQKIQEELFALPDSYEKAAKCEGIYVSADGAFSREDYNRGVWDEFYQKVKNGKEASVIIGNYNSLENALPEQAGSVYYSYVCYDGQGYYVLYDFVDSDGMHDFDTEVEQGKYLLKSGMEEGGSSAAVYYLTDDASVSWRDVLYSSLYAGVNECTPAQPVRAAQIVLLSA